MQQKSLNTIYLTSITQKAQRTYRRVLEGADVGVLWSSVVEETAEPGENHRPVMQHVVSVESSSLLLHKIKT